MNMRMATQNDLSFILTTLRSNKKIVLVRSLMQPLKEPYPLMDICKGPMYVSEEGLHVISLKGMATTFRIVEVKNTSTALHTVELREGQGAWYAPELGPVVLLVPDTK